MITAPVSTVPVCHRVCAWCKADLGDVVVAVNDPTAGRISHGICADCEAKMMADLKPATRSPFVDARRQAFRETRRSIDTKVPFAGFDPGEDPSAS